MLARGIAAVAITEMAISAVALLPQGLLRYSLLGLRSVLCKEVSMELSLLLIVIGIALAILVNYALGIACILIGLVLLIWPRVRASRGTRI